MNADGELMDVEGLRAYLDRQRALRIESLVEQVYAYGQGFGGQAQYEDDFTLVGVEILQAGEVA